VPPSTTDIFGFQDLLVAVDNSSDLPTAPLEGAFTASGRPPAGLELCWMCSDRAPASSGVARSACPRKVPDTANARGDTFGPMTYARPRNALCDDHARVSPGSVMVRLVDRGASDGT